MDFIDRILFDSLDDISKVNIIYTCLLVASAANSLTFISPLEFYTQLRMSFNTTTLSSFLAAPSWVEFDDYDSRQQQQPQQRPSLLLRMAKRLTIYLDNTWAYIQNQFNEHTAASIASCSVLIIVLSIICCFIITLMREEEKRIKEQYKKLNAGSSQSFIAIRSGSEGGSSCGDCYPSGPCSASARLQDCITSGRHLTSNVYQKSSFNQFHGSGSSGGGVGVSYQKIVDNKSALNGAPFTDPPTSSSSSSSSPSSHLLCNSNQREHHNSNHHHHHHHHQQQQQQQPILHKSDKQVRLHELRRETYFGLVRLAKPGCRTIVLLCDAQSRAKLLSKFYQCVYPYRKNKTLQFAFLLIERNIGWYKDLLKSALSEKRYFRINPINCIGTVLVLNGFKKYFSVYHASNARWNPPDDPPFLLLEESLLDNLPEWLERVFASKVNRYYVESWPDKVQYTY